MTEEQIFKARFPEYCVGEKCLPPYFDLFQIGFEEGLNQSNELQEENKELKRQVEQKQHLADVRLEQSLENYKLFSDEQKARIDVDIALDDTTDQLTYAKTIIQDLLDNSDEYARQRAMDWLKEE